MLKQRNREKIGSTSANNGSSDNKGNASNQGNTSNQGGSTVEGEKIHVHTYDNGVVTKEATCTKPDEKTITCTGCGETKTQEIPALGYAEDEGVITEEPTCTEAGVITYTCTRCGEVTRTKEIPASEHAWIHHDEVGHYETVVVKEALTEEVEVWKVVCNGCGAEFDNADEAGLHVMEDFNDECQNYSSRLVGYETIEHPAETEDVWVVDEEAYDECANCGERR